MKAFFVLFLSTAALMMPLAARADTSSLMNRVIVQQSLQQQMQNQLNTQAQELRGQQNISNANLQSQMMRENFQMRQLQLQQQINLLQLQHEANSMRLQQHVHSGAHKASHP